MQWSISDYKHDMGCKKLAPTDDEHHSHQGDIFDNGSPAFREHPSSSMVCKHISSGSLPFFCTGSPVPPPPQRCQVLNPFFFFSFLPFSFFVYKSGSSYLKQKRKKKRNRETYSLSSITYVLCIRTSLSTVPWHPRRLDPRHRRRRDLILRSQPALCEALPGARPLGVGVSRLVVALPAQPDRLDAAVHEEEGGHDPVWADNKHQFD